MDLNYFDFSTCQVFCWETQIHEGHLDTFGHVNNATYLQILELARWEAMLNVGLTLEKIQQEQIGPVILEIQALFKQELKNRQAILIESRFAPHLKSKRLQGIHQIIYKKDQETNKVAFECTFLTGIMDLKNRKLIEPPQHWDFTKF